MKLTIWVLERQNDKSLTAIHAPGMSHRVKETNHFFPLNFEVLKVRLSTFKKWRTGSQN